jgi:hypothetical protein
MKKQTLISYLALLVMMVLPTSIHARESAETTLCMVLTQKDGTVSKFALKESPVMTYEGENIVVNCGDQQLSTEMAGISDIKFEESEIDGIETISNSEPQAAFSFGKASFSGLKADAMVHVYTIDGKMLISTRANIDGEAQIDLGTLSRGIYIVRTPSKSYKIKY